MKILIADDDRVGRDLLRDRLSAWGDEVVAVGDGSTAWDILRRPDAPRLAILNWAMPGMSGPDVCGAVRRHTTGARLEVSEATPSLFPLPYTYLLLVTSPHCAGDLVQGLEAGADDYLVKPFNMHELRARLQTGRRILRLQEELLSAQEELHEKASRDALTGLWNRGTTLDILSRELALGGRTGAPVSVLLTDLDHFKRINDTHGHLAGDAVLREVASRMQAAVRQTDWVGRYGGEEFLIVLPGCAPDKSVSLGERVRNVLASGPVVLAVGAMQVTASVGVAWADQFPEGDASLLLRAADDALYRAKARGRNRVEAAKHEEAVLAV
jgi:diguanylate cyclase (GGDEF)-like protein